MVDIVTRLGKGSPLTNAEVDANFTNLAEVSGVTGEPMGHEDRTTSTISFNASTRTFTITPVASSFTVWCKGKKVVVSTAQTVTIPNTTGMYSIYYDANGVLSAKSGYFTFSLEAPTAYVYWNAATGTAPYFGDERHGVVLDWQTHEYLHRTRGAALASGFSASGYVLGGNGSSNSHAQITLEGGTFFDEDMKIIVTATNTPTAGTWEQDLLSPARIPVLYLSGTGWVIDSPTDYPLKQGTARPQYNAYSGGVWSTADVANNKYATSWILATNNLTYPVIAIIGQAENDLQSAAEAVDFTALQLPGFPSVEFRPLYKLIFQCADSCTNAVHASLVSITDIRSIAAAGTAASIVTDHGNLSGLSDDDHPQYIHVDTLRTVSAAVKASFLPSQTSNAGKFLQTDGTATSWQALTSGNVTTALGFTPYNATNPSGYISGITSGMVTTALGFTPYNATNPSGYVTAAGARGAISVTGAGSYDSATGVINIVGGVTSFNTRTGAITLSSADVTTALGFTPYNNTNPSGYITGITSTMVTTALGFTPYNSSNPNGYISSITSANVTTALGFTPYNATNPSGYITSSALSGYLTSASAASTYLPLSGGTLTGQLVIGAVGTANSPTLRLNTSSASAFVHSQEIFAANLTSGQHVISVIGKVGNTKNSGYIGYTWAGDASNSNYVTIGHWGNDDILRVYGDGNVTVGTNTVLHAGNYNSYAPTLTGGGASGTWGINVTGSAGSATNALRIVFNDGPRDLTDRLPNSFTRTVNFDFVGAGTGNGSGNYAGVMTFSPWTGTTASTGDSSYQLSFANTTGVNASGQPKLSIRNGIDSIWNAWYVLLHSGNVGSYALPLSGGTVTGTLRLGDSSTGLYLSGGRLNIRSESTDNVAEYASYGLYLPKTGQAAGLYVESPIEARGGLRLGSGAGNGTITVGADTGATANRLVQRDSGGDVYQRYSFAVHFNQSGGNSENPTIGQIWTNSTSDNYVRKSTPAHFISQLSLLTTSNYSSYALPLSGGTLTGVLYTNGTSSAVATSDHRRIMHPGGATYVTQSSVITGAIKIKMPLLGSAMMMMATVRVYEYSTGKSFELVYGGHRDSNNWYNEFAYIVGDEGRGDITVRFGVDGSSDCVWIGETGTSWSYPQVWVTDVQIGYAGYSASWHTGWSVSFVTSFDTVNRTRTAYRRLTSGNYSSYALPISGGSLTGALSAVSGLRSYYSDHIAGDGYGIRFWESNAYKISMGASSLYQYGTVTDYSIKMQMDNGSPGRGFTWGRESYAPIASLNATSGNFQTAGQMYVQGAQIASGAFTVRAGGAGGVGWGTGLNIGDSSNYSGFIQDAGISRWRNTGSGGYDWFNSATTQIMALSNSGYLGVGQASDASYRIIASGHIYANANGNIYAEGRHYSRHGTGTFYESLTTGNYTNYAVAAYNTQELSSEISASVGSDGWYTIATHGGSRGYAEFWVYDNDSSRHNFVHLGVVFSFGNGGITVLSSGRHGVSTIRHARLLYNTGNQTYGGAKLQIYCENAAWTIICRMGNDNKFSGWFEWSIITPVLENTPSGWAELNRVEAINDQGVIGGTRLRIGSTDATLSGNQVLHAGNYTNYSPGSGSSWTFGEVYSNGWFRNNNSNQGLYNQSTGGHFCSLASNAWQITGNGGAIELQFRATHNSTVRGYVYGDTGNNFGLLHNGGGWSVQVYSGGNGYLHGTWNGGNIRANRANGNFYIDDNYGYGIVGTYASTRYQGVFAMGDSYKLPADGTSTGSLYGMAWSHPNAGGAAGNLSDHGLLIINNGVFRCAISNSIVAASNITAYSDERLKTNWRDMPENFVARLAQVKVGIYDRTDEEDVTQVGVSAQSFQKLLPQAIMKAKDEMGTLSVSYGNAALASAVELAKDNVELRARIERLESLINKLIGDSP